LRRKKLANFGVLGASFLVAVGTLLALPRVARYTGEGWSVVGLAVVVYLSWFVFFLKLYLMIGVRWYLAWVPAVPMALIMGFLCGSLALLLRLW
jgi:hypothetical protein